MAHRPASAARFSIAAGWLAAVAAAGGLLLAGEARADGGTAGSLMSRADAIRNATLWMPAGAQITSTDCTEMVMDSSPRYVCTVQWGPSGQ